MSAWVDQLSIFSFFCLLQFLEGWLKFKSHCFSLISKNGYLVMILQAKKIFIKNLFKKKIITVKVPNTRRKARRTAMHECHLWQGDVITPTASDCNWRHPIFNVVRCGDLGITSSLTRGVLVVCLYFVFFCFLIIFSHALLLWSFLNIYFQYFIKK